MHNQAIGHGEVGYPYIVVAIQRHCPGARKAAADKWRPGILGPVRTKQRDAASIGAAFLLGHCVGQHFIEVAATLQGFDHVFQNSAASGGVAKTVRHPDIALAVDAEAAAAEACLEGFGLGGIGGGKAGNKVAEGAGYPDAILLVNSKVERPHKRLARRILEALAQQVGFAGISLGEYEVIGYLIPLGYSKLTMDLYS